MRIKANRDVCVGAGMCALTAPALFDQDSEDGLVLVLREHPEPEQFEALKKVVALCPSGALSLGDDETITSSDAS